MRKARAHVSRGKGSRAGVVAIGAACVAFGAVHSLLASRGAKRLAERLLGTRRRNALYRPFYLAQSTVTLGALLLYIRRQPGHTLYHVRGPAALIMRAGQIAGLAYAVAAAHQIGIPGMLGLRGLWAWTRGRDVPPEPEAQGPAIVGGRPPYGALTSSPSRPSPSPGEAHAENRMRVTGPFRLHRHPVNFAPLPVLWLFPRMTTRVAALAGASTVYLLLGSIHEEVRLRAAYGRAYERYQKSGVPFYLPVPSIGDHYQPAPPINSTNPTSTDQAMETRNAVGRPRRFR